MEELLEEINKLTDRKIKAISRDSIKSADVIHLVYITDEQPGISRIKKGKTFIYMLNNERINDKKILQRIKSLVIPPAWENVWVSTIENAHLQATGRDQKKRKQYKYHPHWNQLRNHTKFYRLLEFGKAIPAIRNQLNKDLSLPGLPLEKVLALVLSLMERISIRVGNGVYEKLYGSFGITTLKNKHVKFEGNNIRFSFRGKKGVQQDMSINNRKLANIIKKCRDIPGSELFQYLDEKGERHSIDSGKVNNYIKKISEQDFTAKDFRTWSGTLHALEAFKELGPYETHAEMKRKTIDALDKVSLHLGNTRNVCKKYYVHPLIINLYENKKLENYFQELDEPDNSLPELSSEEKILMKILEKETHKQTKK